MARAVALGSPLPSCQLLKLALPINPTSKEEKGASERAVVLDLGFSPLQKRPVLLRRQKGT